MAIEFRRVTAYSVESTCGWYVLVKPSMREPGPYTAFCGQLQLGIFGHLDDAKARCEQHERDRT